MRFRDRHDAGHALAEKLEHLRGEDVVVVGLARGGVVVAYEVARALEAPLDVLVVRKIGLPWQPELAIGAVAPGVVILRDDVIAEARIARKDVEQSAALEQARLDADLRRYRGDAPAVPLAKRSVILVDDGLATGASAAAAIHSVRLDKPTRVILGEPVCASQSASLLRNEADEVVCAVESDDLVAVGMWYEDFGQVDDDEVRELLERAHREHGMTPREAEQRA